MFYHRGDRKFTLELGGVFTGQTVSNTAIEVHKFGVFTSSEFPPLLGFRIFPTIKEDTLIKIGGSDR